MAVLQPSGHRPGLPSITHSGTKQQFRNKYTYMLILIQLFQFFITLPHFLYDNRRLCKLVYPILFRDTGLAGSELGEQADVTGVTHLPGDSRPPADLGESSLEGHGSAPFTFRPAGPGMFLCRWQGNKRESHHEGGLSLCQCPTWRCPLVKPSDTSEPWVEGTAHVRWPW